jgi:natural product biosynthesis luciferase-like monooxygenase protein
MAEKSEFEQGGSAAHRLGAKPLAFSLFFFSSDGASAEGDKYRLLQESAKFADLHGFAAVWTPERHFDEFGGLYPNPSVINASLAMITERVQLRAGSVVLPLQNPIRVAEEWSVVDNLSRGRAAISFASGWQVNDFVLAPETYADRRDVMFQRIQLVQRLWRGETIMASNGAGKAIEVRIFPKPIQAELPIWITCQSDQTFARAGEAGFNILTSLVYTRIENLAQNIAVYRMMRELHGHDPKQGQVALMLHTFLGDDRDAAQETARVAYRQYLSTNLEFQAEYARAASNVDATMTGDAREYVIARATERLFKTHGLIGTPETCLQLVQRLKAIGVDEIACLIDFGVAIDSVLESLYHLLRLEQLCNPSQPAQLQHKAL